MCRAPAPPLSIFRHSFAGHPASLVLATHGRGMWVIDDITPLRALDAKTMYSEATFLPVKPIQQRINAFGGSWFPQGRSGGEAG